MRFNTLSLLIALAASLIITVPVIAGEQTVNSKVISVTVFPSGAQVTREVKAEFEGGEHQLYITDLPGDLLAQSLRIEGEGPANLVIGSIDQKIVTLPLSSEKEKAEVKALKVELNRLRDEKVLLNASIEAADLQKKLLNEMVLVPSRRPSPSETDDQSGQLQTFSGLYNLMGDKFVEASKRALEARVKLRELDREIKNVMRRLAEKPKQKQRKTRLTLNVSAGKAGGARFIVRYQIANASWWPIYDARLKTGKTKGLAKLDLVRRAVIQQRSSEDWENVALTLSTANPSGRTQPPWLGSQLVDYKQQALIGLQNMAPAAEGIMDMRSEDDGRARGGAKKRFAKAKPASPAPPRAIKRQSVVNSGQYQMTFSVEGLSTIKRNGEKKKVYLDDITLKPDVRLFSVPKLASNAFLQAVFVNKSEDPIIAGEAALFRDGIYVGQTRLELIEPQQKYKLSFGIDPKVKIKWVKLDRVKGKTGILTTSNSDVRRYKISVNNGHDYALPITILDQIPFSEKEQIVVTLMPTSVKPSRRNVDDRRGVLAWDKEAPSGGGFELEFGYQIIWPKDKSIVIQRR